MRKIKVKLGRRSYSILIGSGIIAALGSILRQLDLGDTAVIITNPVVKKLFGVRLSLALRKSGFRYKFIEVPDSETSKSRAVAFRVINRIAGMDTNKKIFIIALGGGVVGDLAGFVASIYKRGVAYVQVPTTLLAQIDSSIGGKVAIDLAFGKNLIGAFYQPKLVLSDVLLMKSLGRREVRSGLAEAVKYGVILDQRLFEFIERNQKALLNLNQKALEQLVERCSALKAKIVQLDEKEEEGKRTILNFGHTIGHAVEAASKYKAINHGEAVAFGMVCAAEIACKLGRFDERSKKRIVTLIEKIGLPTRLSKMDLNRVLTALSHDKKFISGKNRFVLPIKIGKVKIMTAVPQEIIRQVISSRLN